uniref:Uncharacterized protein n=1 Tax=Oryza punctata TaxID=4537 RepID=A0A0E0JEX9_ORYPU
MVRALLVMSCVARLNDEDMGAGGSVKEAWVTSRGSVPSAEAKYQVIDRFHWIAISWFPPS